MRHQGIGMTSQRTRDRLIKRLQEKGIVYQGVLDAMREIPRHIFMDEAMATRAYEDTALPIGYGQTISQPFIVALMTQILMADKKPAKVLEIGTGSGYQAAILARLVDQVYSVERIVALQKQARERFWDLGLKNIRLKHDDGNTGWAHYAPYDGIIATAAPEVVPPELLAQLADGGRLVIPVGPQGDQQLMKITRHGDDFNAESIEQVSFVPMLPGAA